MQLQKLGLEIRKIGSLNNLYSDIDLVLSKARVRAGDVSYPVQQLTVAHALQKMMQVDKYLSVCTIKECAKLANIVISKERMTIYDPLNYMNWNEMMPEFRQVIIAMILDDFRTVLNP